MKKLSILIPTLFLFTISSFSFGVIHYRDGLFHSTDDTIYENYYVLDDVDPFDSPPNPGTHLEIADGAVVTILQAKNYSTVTMTGGSGHTLDVMNNASFTMINGVVDDLIGAVDNASITMTGGTVNVLWALDNAVIILSGGTVEYFDLHNDVKAYLIGTNFKMDNQPLFYGDKLGNISGSRLTGILADGSVVNISLGLTHASEVIIIPEPSTLLLLGLGGLALRKRTK